MELVTVDVHGLELGVGDLDLVGVGALVEPVCGYATGAVRDL
jgi:hypothetical protein